MIGLLLLALVELPLGPVARPGVPVLLTSDQPTVVDIGGWKWLVDGPTEVYPPALPATIVFEGGRLALREGHPTEARLDGLKLVRGVRPQTLDVFERIRFDAEPEPWVRELLDAWVAMGGELIEGTDRAPPSPWERVGNVMPEMYDLAPGRGEGSAAHAVARRFAVGMAVALAVLLLLRPRRVRLLCLAVAVVGGGAGWYQVNAALESWSVAEVHIHYGARTRIFSFYRAEIDGATTPAPEGMPFFYRGPGEPWWEDESRILKADEGIIRGFVRDVPRREPSRTGSEEERRILRPVLRRHAGGAETRWWWGREVFSGIADPGPPILEIEVDAVR